MAPRFHTIVIDSTDPAGLATFWAELLDWQVLFEDDDEIVVGKDDETYPALVFLPVPEAKAGKNRLHIDLAPDDRDAEVARAITLGAQPVDIGQGSDVTWVVLADPEGNEFCILSSRDGGL